MQGGRTSMHSFMDCHGLRFKILLVMCLSILMDDSSATYVNVNTFGDGTTVLTCSAQDVLDMQWSVSYFGMSQNIDLDTILDSDIEYFTVTDGITLYSTVYYDRFYYNRDIESTMRVISQSGDGVQRTQVTFVCSGRTQFRGNFRNENTISATLANPTTPSEVPHTSPPPTDSESTASTDPVSTTLQTMETAPDTSTPSSSSQPTHSSDDVTTNSSSPPITSSGDDTPSSSPPPTTSSEGGLLLVGIWIAVVAVALLIICNMTTVVCRIVVKYRASKKCVQATEEEMHHYDHNSHGIDSQTVPNTTGEQPVLPTPPATDVPLRDTEPYYTSILYSQPVTATGRGNSVHTDGQMGMTRNVAYNLYISHEN